MVVRFWSSDVAFATCRLLQRASQRASCIVRPAGPRSGNATLAAVVPGARNLSEIARLRAELANLAAVESAVNDEEPNHAKQGKDAERPVPSYAEGRVLRREADPESP